MNPIQTHGVDLILNKELYLIREPIKRQFNQDLIFLKWNDLEFEYDLICYYSAHELSLTSFNREAWPPLCNTQSRDYQVRKISPSH